MVFVADDLAAWLIGLFADAGRKKLTSVVLGSEQERALRSAATAAVQCTAEELRPGDAERAGQLAMVVSEVFGGRVPGVSLAGGVTVLEGLQAGIAGQLAVLDDASLTGMGQSSADVLGVQAGVLGSMLAGYLLEEIIGRGARGGPLQPLANQLNHDRAHLQGLRVEGKVNELDDKLLEVLGRLDASHSVVATVPTFHAVRPYVSNAPFTGRAQDLGVLDEWARSADPVMVVEGIGGTGKSALAWQWAHERAPTAMAGLAGRLWWAFPSGPASMTSFLQELFAYTSGLPVKQARELGRAEVGDQALAALRSRPYLVVLDGMEQLTAVYQSFEHGFEGVESGRSLIDPRADGLVGRLAAARPSKILISTRLLPAALQDRFGREAPGVRHLVLTGLADADTRELLGRLGVRGSESAIAGFFGPLGNNPLLTGLVAGLVRSYRPDPGGFDRWLADPAAGGSLQPPGLPAIQRRTHILAAALTGLQPGSWRLLRWVSMLDRTASRATQEAISPLDPEPPAPAEADLASLGPMPDPFDNEPAYQAWEAAVRRLTAQAARETQERLAAWRSSEPVIRAKAQLAALKDLEERGLLWLDHSSNSYELHPVIRSSVYMNLARYEEAISERNQSAGRDTP
jgi:hypothetical protein